MDKFKIVIISLLLAVCSCTTNSPISDDLNVANSKTNYLNFNDAIYNLDDEKSVSEFLQEIGIKEMQIEDKTLSTIDGREYLIIRGYVINQIDNTIDTFLSIPLLVSTHVNSLKNSNNNQYNYVYAGCIMKCISGNCTSCRQDIITVCKSFTCKCENESGNSESDCIPDKISHTF
jgi:hypothetical protein